MSNQPEQQPNIEQKAEVPTQSHTIAKPNVGSSTTSHTSSHVWDKVRLSDLMDEINEFETVKKQGDENLVIVNNICVLLNRLPYGRAIGILEKVQSKIMSMAVINNDVL